MRMRGRDQIETLMVVGLVVLVVLHVALTLVALA